MEKSLLKNKMTDFERECALTLANGSKNALPIVHIVWTLEPKKRRDYALYLIKKGIVGDRLYEVYQECGDSPVTFLNYLGSRVNPYIGHDLILRDLI